jgi:hypothetical protein
MLSNNMSIKSYKIVYLIFLLIIAKFFAACTPDSCFEETTSFLNATFYKTVNGVPSAPDSITIFGIGKETNRLYSKSLNLTAIKLPLNASAGTCGYVMKINNITDTLRFIYTGYPHLISKECGITFYFTLDTCIAHGSAIKTIITRNNNITTFNEENIRIYY